MTRRDLPYRAALRSALHVSLLAAATFSLLPAGAQTTDSPMSRNAQEAAPATPYHGTVVEQIVARVNDRVISTSDYQRALDELDQQAKQRNWSQADLDDQKKNLLRDLIDNQLLLSKGKQLGITGDAETIRELDEMRKQNNLPSMEALEKAAADQGVNFADFKANIQNRVITSQVIRDQVGRMINITDADEHRYYDAHKDQFTSPEMVNVSEILIPTADPDNAKQVADAKTKADAIEADLKSGKSFADLAKADSSGSTAAQGGELGDYKHGQLPQVFEDAVFPMAAGGITQPVRTKQGYVILKVNTHIAGGVQPFNQVQTQVENAVGEEQMQPKLRQYLTQLREEASIEILSGYTDAAATPNEIHPDLYFSAYAPPKKKVKKPKNRTRFTVRGRTRGSDKQLARSGAAAGAGAAVVDVSGDTAQTPTAKTKDKKQHTEEAGKREKVRFGQAPRETLPAATAATRTQDAGAAPVNGNASEADTALAQQGNMQYENGEAASDEQAAPKKEKTRYSQVAVKEHKAKVRKEKADAAAQAPAPADSQEVSDVKEQSQPLGLNGDTAKPAKQPKPHYTGKTRFSEEAGKPKPGTTTGNPTGTPAPNEGTASHPAQEPSTQPNPGAQAPVQTQTTPTGSGDPLGNPTPAAQPQTNNQPQ